MGVNNSWGFSELFGPNRAVVLTRILQCNLWFYIRHVLGLIIFASLSAISSPLQDQATRMTAVMMRMMEMEKMVLVGTVFILAVVAAAVIDLQKFNIKCGTREHKDYCNARFASGQW